MKKLFLLMALLSTALLVNAQKWEKTYSPADELKGIKEHTTYTFLLEGAGAFVWSDAAEDQFIIVNQLGIFDYQRASGYTGALVNVGLYDKDNNLLEKMTMWLDTPSGSGNTLRTRNAGSMSNPVGQKKKVKKIVNHFRNTDGYVRIVAGTYGNKPDFDMCITRLVIEDL